MGATTRTCADSPIQFDNVVFNMVTHQLDFDISIRRLSESSKAAFIAAMTAWGATLGTMTKTITGTASLTTGDADIHVQLV